MTSSSLVPPTPRRWVAPAVTALVTAAVTCAALAILMRWNHARWDVPFDYDGDARLMQIIIQTGLEQPWYLDTPRLNAPHGLAMYDYPCADTLDVVLAKVIGVFDHRPAVVLNLLYVLGYPLAALSMLCAARWLGFGWPAAAAAGVLFAFLPFHALRGEAHLFLSTYFPMPLMAAIIVEITMGRLPFFPERDGRLRFRLTDGRTLRAVVVAALFGTANPYWGYFALLLLAAAGVVDLASRRRWRGVWSALLVGGVLAVSMTVNTLPSLIYQLHHGTNSRAHGRSRAEAEQFGLKFSHLVLPAPDHRSNWVQKFRDFYRSEDRPLENENKTAALGVVATVGFLALLAVALLPRLGRSPRTTALAQLNLVAFLLGTMGGIGVVMNLAFAQFRCYNRLSVFIGFFALLTVFGWIDAGLTRCNRGKRRAALLLATAGLVAFGIWDGATWQIRPVYAETAARWDTDAAFMRSVEDGLPPASLVFQLPIVRFQEPPVLGYELPDYQLAIGYFHSTKLRWSYGAMVGRPAAAWQTEIGERLETEETMDAALAELKGIGFHALWIDWRGYGEKDCPALRERVVKRLGEPFAKHPNGVTEGYRIPE